MTFIGKGLCYKVQHKSVGPFLLVMEKSGNTDKHRGKIVERGTHKELLAQQGYYYELVKNQLELNKY